jgi:hypothetical protein
MWARVASFEGADIERLRAEARRPPDAASGRQLFITLFDTREAIEAAEATFEQMGDEIPEEVRGRRVSKDYYEVTLGVLQLT